jgi:predicted dehydrogenase
MSKREPIRLAVVGCGPRARVYSSYVKEHPDAARIVAVADPNHARRDAYCDEYGVPPAMRFDRHTDIAARPGLADAVVNCTMDRLHVPIGLPLLEAGFHMLMEKPISPVEREVRDMVAAARRHGRIVMIGHVLRYAPFFTLVKRALVEGRIGDVVAIHSQENVWYWHMAVAFVTGKYNRRDTSSPMLLAKCCHDLDLIAWFMSGVPVKRVASFGSIKQFRPENAPPGSTDRCLNGCAVEPTCNYSARRLYVDHDLGWGGAWESFVEPEKLMREDKLRSLATDNPHGRCVWRCDNTVVDHQCVIVEWANGVTATHNMWGGASRACRKIMIMGTTGEIEGDLDEGTLTIRNHDPDAERSFRAETIDVRQIDAASVGGHGGGDHRLIADFLARIRGDSASLASTRIEDSLTGHLIAFAADSAMLEHRVVEVDNTTLDASASNKPDAAPVALAAE